MMTQTLTAASKPVALDYDNTLVVAIELSNVSWVLAAQVPGLPRLKAKRGVEPTAEALMAAINGYRNRAREAGRMVERVIAVYEASGSGFWLARWLERGGIEIHIIQPSSVPVDRRARRAKFDGIDAGVLLETLLATLPGVGVQSATVLVREAFVREFPNGKALGSYAGLTATPYSSGGAEREQGI